MQTSLLLNVALIFAFQICWVLCYKQDETGYVQRPNIGYWHNLVPQAARMVLPHPKDEMKVSTPRSDHATTTEALRLRKNPSMFADADFDVAKLATMEPAQSLSYPNLTADLPTDGAHTGRPPPLSINLLEPFNEEIKRLSGTSRRYYDDAPPDSKLLRLYNNQWDRMLNLTTFLVKREITLAVGESIKSLVHDYLPQVQSQVHEFLRRGKAHAQSVGNRRSGASEAIDVPDPRIPAAKWLNFLSISKAEWKRAIRTAYDSLINDSSASIDLILTDTIKRCTQAVVKQTARFFHWNTDRNAPKFVYGKDEEIWHFPADMPPTQGPAVLNHTNGPNAQELPKSRKLVRRGLDSLRAKFRGESGSQSLDKAPLSRAEAEFWRNICGRFVDFKSIGSVYLQDAELAAFICSQADSHLALRLFKRDRLKYPADFYKDHSNEYNEEHTRLKFGFEPARWRFLKLFRRKFQILVDRIINFNLYYGIYAELETTVNQFTVFVQQMMPSIIKKTLGLLQPKDFDSEPVQKLLNVEGRVFEEHLKLFSDNILHDAYSKGILHKKQNFERETEEDPLYPFYLAIAEGSDYVTVFKQLLDYLEQRESVGGETSRSQQGISTAKGQNFYTMLYGTNLALCVNKHHTLNYPESSEVSAASSCSGHSCESAKDPCSLVDRADRRTAQIKVPSLPSRSPSGTTEVSESDYDPMQASGLESLHGVDYLVGKRCLAKQVEYMRGFTVTRASCDKSVSVEFGPRGFWYQISDACRTFLQRAQAAMVGSWERLKLIPGITVQQINMFAMASVTMIIRQWSLLPLQISRWTARLGKASRRKLTNFLCAEVNLQVHTRAGLRSLGYFYSPQVKPIAPN